MKVLALYHAPVRTVAPNESLSDAADRMSFYDIGALAVIEHTRLVGIITERDLVRAMGDEVAPTRTTIDRYMTPGAVCIEPDDDTQLALAKMTALNVRHLPVVDHDEVVGMISIRDLALATAAV